jgi:hypothetical protein
MTKSRDLANAATALNAVTAAELGYVDGVTSAIQTQLDAKLASSTAATTYVANALADAKGDIFVASADNTVTRLPVGSTGDTIVADSSTSTGLRYNPTTGNQNFLVNGNLDIWQRGTSFVNPATNAYTADRWATIYTVNQTTSRQTTGVPAGSTYCARFTYTGAGAIAMQAQALESSMVKMLAGKTVTVSVKLRRNASFSTSIYLTLSKNATADTFAGGTWTDIASTPITNAQLPTGTTSADWYTATLTTAIPNDGTANGLRVLVAEAATGSSGAYWEMAQVKLEIGSVATAMTLSGGTIQGELAACQRYYWRAGGNTVYQTFTNAGVAGNTSTVQVNLISPVPMRAVPTVLEYANLGLTDTVSTNAISNLVIAQQGIISNLLQATSSSLTQYRPYMVNANNSTSAYIAVGAEL